MKKWITIGLFLIMNGSLASSPSLYDVSLSFTSDQGKTVLLSSFSGAPVVLAMIYTSCPHVCPLIVKKVKSIADQAKNEKVSYVLVTMDPSVDSVERLKEYKKKQGVDYSNWHFLRGDEETTRRLSLLMDVSYQKDLETGHFMHDNKIVLLNKEGVLEWTLEGLDADESPIVNKLKVSFWQRFKRGFNR